MAFTRSVRCGWFVAALAVLTFSSPSFASGDQTTAGTGSGWGNCYALTLSVADFAPTAIFADIKADRRIASDYQAFQPMAVKERASRSAVRPTALTGWRSGRTRYLAS